MIVTALTELLGVQVPLLNARITPQAGGALARAVSEARQDGAIVAEIETQAADLFRRWPSVKSS